jgi:hypothetical protein
MIDVKAIAVGTEELPYRTIVANEEKDKLNEEYVKGQIEISNIEEELETIKAMFKDRMKPTKERQAELLHLLKKGFREENKTHYLIPDHEHNEMKYVLDTGEEVFTRKMRPEEKQMNILDFQQTGTGGK